MARRARAGAARLLAPAGEADILVAMEEGAPVRSRWLAAAAGAAALAVLGVGAFFGAGTDDRPRVVVSAPPPAFHAAPPAIGDVRAAAAPVPAATSAEPEPPPGLSREQWAALVAEMKNRADGSAELHRLSGYFAWSDTLQRFRDARRAGAGADELRPLAQALDAGLAERLRRAEVSAGEARQIESAILAVTVADEAQRGERLQRWAATSFAPAAPTAPDPRQAAFERQQGEIVAAWSALPAAARDRAALARELEAARLRSFADTGR